MRIMSSNIWGDYFGNPVEERQDGLGAVFARYAPDVLCMQEATKSWNNSALFARLAEDYAPACTIEGVNIFVPVYYKKSVFRLLEGRYHHYDDTPDISKGYVSAVLEETAGGKRIGVIGTHFWWRYPGEVLHDAFRVSNAAFVTAEAMRIEREYGAPVIACGDLNCYADAPALAYLRGVKWESARDIAPITSEISTHHGDPVRGEDGRYHGRRTANRWDRSLDYIFCRGALTAQTFAVIEDQDALDATDHSPIYLDFTL